ncbi:DUF2273 domain-containing protein [Thermoflavimicrobium daqui]|jgi:uncharacterized membrane protein|uniref:DUF2273 domain-containing protein n=1 Tax=Thermoflavimicrobium daqui TaxID=2137476 RepID=A0A364K8D5_9BACL|nr:DUF2273 domain-containing protein [Thermoflavimicrobium daqui]RAL26559.1 hypothetical protein DL897_00465 [Thermoflavimicrobium daqui]
MDKHFLKGVWLQYGGRIVGSFIGIALGLVYLFVGFWKMLFFALLAGLGYFLGRQFDRKEDLKEVIDTIILEKWMRK